MIDNTHRLDREDHFRTDVSYLPDLTAYLDDLLRTRERLAAASGADSWASAAAAPSAQEISKIRQLISQIKAGVEDLAPDERDLLEKIHALEAAPPAAGQAAGPAVTRASLQADLLAAHERAARLNAQVRQLEKRLSEALGEHAWRESGLGAPPDIDALNDKISQLEQQAADLRIQLSERDDELAAARAANRELITRINHAPKN